MTNDYSNTHLAKKMEKWPVQDMIEWPIERWKDMFDGVNLDSVEEFDGTYVPYSDIVFYAEQISNHFEANYHNISWEDALLKAQQMLRMEIADMCAVLVIQNNKENWANNEDNYNGPVPANYGSAPETAEAVLQGLFEEVAKVVEKKQEELISKR